MKRVGYKDLQKGREAQKRWREKNPEKSTFYRKRDGWKRQGIRKDNGDLFLPIDFDSLYQIQGGSCAICKRHQLDLGRTLHVDHDHKTGQIRGLLCDICNGKMGVLEDMTFIEKGKKYLEGVR